MVQIKPFSSWPRHRWHEATQHSNFVATSFFDVSLVCLGSKHSCQLLIQGFKLAYSQLLCHSDWGFFSLWIKFSIVYTSTSAANSFSCRWRTMYPCAVTFTAHKAYIINISKSNTQKKHWPTHSQLPFTLLLLSEYTDVCHHSYWWIQSEYNLCNIKQLLQTTNTMRLFWSVHSFTGWKTCVYSEETEHTVYFILPQSPGYESRLETWQELRQRRSEILQGHIEEGDGERCVIAPRCTESLWWDDTFCELFFSGSWQRLGLRLILSLSKRAGPAPVSWKNVANLLAEAAESNYTVGNIIKNACVHMYLHCTISAQPQNTHPVFPLDSHTVTCMHTQSAARRQKNPSTAWHYPADCLNWSLQQEGFTLSAHPILMRF